MKTSIVYIISVFLLCVGCSLEIEPQFEYVETFGSNGCYTVWVRMPENLKIVNAQLKSHKLTVEYDSGRGKDRDKWVYSSSNRLYDVSESVQFRGTNRIDRFTLLYFTKEEPKGKFNPPIGTTKITSRLKEREEFAIFRTSNWLIIHYSIKRTDLGRLLLHNLRKHYAKNRNSKGKMTSLKTIDGKMSFNLAFNKRSFLIDRYYGKDETYNSIGENRIVSEDKLKWTWLYKIDSNQDKDQ